MLYIFTRWVNLTIIQANLHTKLSFLLDTVSTVNHRSWENSILNTSVLCVCVQMGSCLGVFIDMHVLQHGDQRTTSFLRQALFWVTATYARLAGPQVFSFCNPLSHRLTDTLPHLASCGFWGSGPHTGKPRAFPTELSSRASVFFLMLALHLQ